ncbi:MAG: SPFH domain-containing protein [Spirochaetales bacterium]|nr:SPFH domain-containing protein [Spirochaetales bacterium]
MFGIRFIKFDATTHAIVYKKGKLKREGRGLAFYFHAPTTSIVAVPTGSKDIQFIFHNTTADYQAVSIQGQITYKIEDPRQIAEMLDFSVDVRGNYKSDDPEKLGQRLINEAQASVSSYMQNLELREALKKAKEIEEHIFTGLTASRAVKLVGVVPLSVNVMAVKPAPEMAKALETKTREDLLKDADEAIYRRRKFAVEEEQKIKESELNTEIAVEEKKKQIAEKKMESQLLTAHNDRKLREIKVDADIAVEQQKQGLIDMQAAHMRKEADAKAYVLDATLTPYKGFDWKLLMAINTKGNDAQSNIALAFRELAEKAENISNLSITPELLTSLVQQQKTAK